MANTRQETDIPENPDRQQRQWRAERIGWVSAGIILLLAVVGVFGAGPVSRTTASDSGDDLRVTYERITRRDARETITVEAAISAGSETLDLHLGGELADRVWLESVVPEPESMASDADGLHMTFAVPPGSDVTTITFTIEHDSFGRSASSIQLDEGTNVDFTQWVLP